MRKRRRTPRYRADPSTLHRLVASNKPYSVNSVLDIKLRAAMSLKKLIDRTATTGDFDHLAISLNVARAQAEGINPEMLELVRLGQSAMQQLKERHVAGQPLYATEVEAAAINQALEFYNAFIDVTTPANLLATVDAAEKAVSLQIRKKGKAS